MKKFVYLSLILMITLVSCSDKVEEYNTLKGTTWENKNIYKKINNKEYAEIIEITFKSHNEAIFEGNVYDFQKYANSSPTTRPKPIETLTIKLTYTFDNPNVTLSSQKSETTKLHSVGKIIYIDKDESMMSTTNHLGDELTLYHYR